MVEQRPAYRIYQELIEAIGIEATHQLLAHFGGGQWYLPTLRTITRFERDRMIRSDALQGKSQEELAIEYGLTRQRIGQILKGKR